MRNRRLFALGATVLLLSGVTFASAKSPNAESPAEPSDNVSSATELKAKVSAKSTSYDPPVAKSEIPSGAWMCDMGTVHYARSKKGDGTCPRCNMKLVQKGADKKHAGHTH